MRNELHSVTVMRRLSERNAMIGISAASDLSDETVLRAGTEINYRIVVRQTNDLAHMIVVHPLREFHR